MQAVEETTATPLGCVAVQAASIPRMVVIASPEHSNSPEAIKRRQILDRWIGIPAIDLRPQEMQLLVELLFRQFSPPGFRTAVGAVRLAIAARLEVVLHVEWAAFRIDANP